MGWDATSDPAVPVAAGLDTSGKPVAVYLTTAVRTSQGPGPGVKLLPPQEAGGLITARLAVAGDKPPRSFLGAL
jgi:hypothetical protein